MYVYSNILTFQFCIKQIVEDEKKAKNADRLLSAFVHLLLKLVVSMVRGMRFKARL